ncbi:MAG: hypothetical protein IKD09_07385 [Lentisphaeria bacterium]|nr:hypothetical protein [Lentisphaeria bacterium]
MELSLTGREGLGRCDNYREVYEIREDQGASVSKIFRPDRQNGFISATVAKSSRRHAEERKRRSIQSTSRQARTSSLL